MSYYTNFNKGVENCFEVVPNNEIGGNRTLSKGWSGYEARPEISRVQPFMGFLPDECVFRLSPAETIRLLFVLFVIPTRPDDH